MSFLPTLRSSFPRRLATSSRAFTTTPTRFTTAGYGDPQDEKIENRTPGIKGKNASTAPEMKENKQEGGKGKVGSGGGKEGAGDKAKEDVTAGEIRQTKKIGEEPKNTQEGGAGPKGG
jgi:hypothetical protein